MVINKNAKITSSLLKEAIEYHLQFTQHEVADTQNRSAYWQATCLALNDLVVTKLQACRARQNDEDLKTVKKAFEDFFGTKKVVVKGDGKGKESGTISLQFTSKEELEQFYKAVEL